MARTHGFRIFVVQAFNDRMKGRDPEDASATSNVRTQIESLLEQLADHGTYFTDPKTPPKAGEPEKPSVSLTVGEPVIVNQYLIHIPVATGEKGSHRQATGDDAEPTVIEHLSAEADHYMTFIFPKGGDRFLLVAHTIRRRDPSLQLLAKMTAQSLQNKKYAVAAETAARKAAKKAGDPLPPRTQHSRLLFHRIQAADNSYLDEIIGSASSASAVFQTSEASGRGRGGERVLRTLRIQLFDDSDREIGRKTARSWLRKTRANDPTTRKGGVSELGALLEEANLLSDEEWASYDQASVHITNKGGASTSIAVDTLRDVFTYPVSDGPPSVYFYYEKVAPRVKTVALEEEVELVDIDPLEVEQCLETSTGLTSGLS